jgi:thioester reductase-like protein
MNILITGASGFIGRRLVKELLSETQTEKHKLFLLTRPQSKNACLELFGKDPRITYIEGDIEDTDVLLNIYSVSKVIDQVDTVVHLAALYDLTAGLKESYLKNVIGTQNMINLLKKMKGVKTFHYFSTYAVNPVSEGVVREEQLARDEAPFPNQYTRTKNDAEHLVRNQTPSHIKVVIHRPAVIVGDSETGRLDKIDGPYYFYEFIRKLKMLGPAATRIPVIPMPLSKGSLFPVLPVNYLVKWCAHIITHPPKERLRTYHLVSEELIDTKIFLEDSMELMGVSSKLMPFKYTKVFPPLFPFLNMPTEIIFYMKQAVVFDRKTLSEDYPELKAPPYKEYLPKIIEGYLEAQR